MIAIFQLKHDLNPFHVKGLFLYQWHETSLLNYGLRAFIPYVPSRLTRLRTLLAFAPYMPYSRALSTRPARLVKIVLGWICSPAKTFHFPWIIKDATNCVVLTKSFDLK